jgi:polyribonucleotide nucleotidyltransferase
VSVFQRRHVADTRHRFRQDFLPLAVKLGRQNADPGRVAAGFGQRMGEAGSDQILRHGHDRDGLRRL